MDAYFPAPFPDESLYSLMARYRVSLPHSNRHVSHREFGYEQALSKPSSIGQDALAFYRRHSEFWKSERNFIRTMTASNLIFPFLTKSVQDRFYKALQGYSSGVNSLLRPYIYFPNHNFGSLKYCPECVIHDIDQYGVAYWHCSHCVWFATACWQHGCCLKEVQNESRFELPPQHQANSELGRADDSGVALCILVKELLGGGLPWGVSMSDIRACYQEVITVKSSEIKAFARGLQCELEENCTPELLQLLKIRRTFNGTGRRLWVYDVLKGHSIEHIPEHLLVINQLFSSIQRLREVLTTSDHVS
ncbi:hypothetical protein GZ77_24675 [Endozoicomonas montiporae]|uniref:TniQ domain-containing protein n=2 Tax=Endozoicomonas montiporae TaxID=1027273 RepID=A0A081MZT4_9GAMM|nr:TniQ family protein [Endozoicomonas montiporae]AMO54601.1 hypothetical protein EZMO1_0349 [Endozoicomonas montiporae CL-33]KEQ11707.1 hypothetical protein GZ77_24675 [Endozoicomonas montiporae]